MQGHLENHGQFELFETTHGHQILNLNNQQFFAVVEGQKGDLLVRSDADHRKKRTLEHGDFFLADFADDPEFNDIPHLFLKQSQSRYIEWVLPQGLPTRTDHQKKLVRTGNTVARDKVLYHVEGSGAKGREKQYRGTKRHAGSQAEAAGHVGGDLSQLSKQELYEMAKQREIAGRSKLNKRQLLERLSG